MIIDAKIKDNISTKTAKLGGGINTGGGTGANNIHTDTTEHWNAQRDLVAKKNHIYVYTDYEVVEGINVSAMKVGDGTSYLIDMPFIDGNHTKLNAHIDDTDMHINPGEREFWNNKVTAFVSQGDVETLVLTKDNV